MRINEGVRRACVAMPTRRQIRYRKTEERKKIKSKPKIKRNVARKFVLGKLFWMWLDCKRGKKSRLKLVQSTVNFVVISQHTHTQCWRLRIHTMHEYVTHSYEEQLTTDITREKARSMRDKRKWIREKAIFAADSWIIFCLMIFRSFYRRSLLKCRTVGDLDRIDDLSLLTFHSVLFFFVIWFRWNHRFGLEQIWVKYSSCKIRKMEILFLVRMRLGRQNRNN